MWYWFKKRRIKHNNQDEGGGEGGGVGRENLVFWFYFVGWACSTCLKYLLVYVLLEVFKEPIIFPCVINIYII